MTREYIAASFSNDAATMRNRHSGYPERLPDSTSDSLFSSPNLLFLQRTIGNRAVLSLMPAHPKKAPHSPDPPISVQRKVGFEFETGWGVDKDGKHLKKKEQVGKGGLEGFKIEADEAGVGESEIEFIVFPPVEEGEKGLADLGRTMSYIVQLGNKMIDVAGKSEFRRFRFSEATEDQKDRTYYVTPKNDELRAGPQVTTGLDLAKIRHLHDIHETGPPVPGELERTLRSLQGGARRVADVARWRGGKEVSPAMQGLIAILVNYIEAGADRNRDQNMTGADKHMTALSYPKRIGDLLLARNDMASLFKLLPAEEIGIYSKSPSLFLGLVLNSLDSSLGIKGCHPLFARGIQKNESDPSQGIDVPKLTVGEWVNGIAEQGFDWLRGVPDAESMGEFGNRTEKVGKAPGNNTPDTRLDVGIFEFRDAQKIKIPLSEWMVFSTSFHNYITKVHSI